MAAVYHAQMRILARETVRPDICKYLQMSWQARALFHRTVHNNSMIVWRDGEFLAAELAHCDALSTSHLVGWGVFSTFRIANGQAIWPQQHLNRLRRDGLAMELQSHYEDDVLCAAIEHLIEVNHIHNGFGRATLSGGRDARWGGFTPAQSLLSVAHLPEIAPAALRVWLSDAHMDARRPLCGIKSTSYAMWQLLWQQGQKRGCEETLLRDSNGALCEGARSNLVWKRGETLFTPALSTGCLPGIARQWLLNSALRNGWICHETHATPEELCTAQEIWLLNAVSGPRAVQEIVTDASTQNAENVAFASTAIWTRDANQATSFVTMLQELWAQDIARNAAF